MLAGSATTERSLESFSEFIEDPSFPRLITGTVELCDRPANLGVDFQKLIS